MGKFKVVITDREYENIENEIRILNNVGADVFAYQFRNEDDILKVAHDCDGLIVQRAKLSKSTIEKLDRCKVIAKYATGIDGIDIVAATEKNIFVTNVNEYCSDEVSTHALALILDLSRKLYLYDKHIRKNVWDYKSTTPIHSLKSSIVGIIGFGKISRLLIKKLKPICNEIWVYSNSASCDDVANVGAKLKSFEEIIKYADIISIHSPLTTETNHLFNKEVFSKMKKTSSLVNIARGALVCEEDLIWALENKVIESAALDVLETEPPNPDNKLLTLENVILSPHVGWYSIEAQEKLQTAVANDVARVLTNKYPLNLVNKELERKFIL